MGADSGGPDYNSYVSPSPRSVHMSSDEEELNAVVPVATDPPDEHQYDYGYQELATINDGTMLDQLKEMNRTKDIPVNQVISEEDGKHSLYVNKI